MRANIWICHSRYDHRKDTPPRLIGMGSIGNFRFNALKLWNWNKQQMEVIPSMYPNWTNIIIRWKGTDGVTTYFYQEMGLKHSPVSEPHSGDGTRNRAECLSDTAFSRRDPTESTLYRYRTPSVSRRNLEATGLPPPDRQTAWGGLLRHSPAPWNTETEVSPWFTLHKIEDDFTRLFNPRKARPAVPLYDIIYFDAFAPEKQPEMWNNLFSILLYKVLNEGGILTTYCAKGW